MFFLADLFIYFKKGIAVFVTIFVTGITTRHTKFVDIFYRMNERKRLDQIYIGGLLPWKLDVLDCRHIIHNSRKG
jgi:hypothetical protein